MKKIKVTDGHDYLLEASIFKGMPGAYERLEEMARVKYRGNPGGTTQISSSWFLAVVEFLHTRGYCIALDESEAPAPLQFSQRKR